MLQVKAVGICGSDLHWFAKGGIGDVQLEHPLVLGHEFSGITAPCWNRDYESGQRVAVDPAIPCRQCELCQHGHPNLCERVAFAGHGARDGALREWMAWDEKNMIPIPDSLTYADGAMLEPLGVAIHAVDLAHLEAGMKVGVFGCGAIGLLIVQLARLSGAATIIATDRLVHRVEAAGSLGATKAILAEGGAEIQEVMAATGGGRNVFYSRSPRGESHPGRHPGQRYHVVSCLGGTPQGADHQNGAAHETYLSACD
jgi:L-iditol 2-dehydrogenase